MFRACPRLILFSFLLSLLAGSAAQAAERMTYDELMKVRKIQSTVISDDGDWVAYAVQPDRGDGEGFVVGWRGRPEYRVDRGYDPQLSFDGSFAAFRVATPFEEQETLEPDERSKPGLLLLATDSGQRLEFERVRSSAFSEDSQWVAVHFEKPEDEADSLASDPDMPEDSDVAADEEKTEREAGTRLLLQRLRDGREWAFESVVRYGFDPTSGHLAVAVQTETGDENRFELWSLGDEPRAQRLHEEANAAYPALAWADEAAALAFLVGSEDEPGEVEDIGLRVWSALGSNAFEAGAWPVDWRIPGENELVWSKDAQRLFFGLRPQEPGDAGAEDSESAVAEGDSEIDGESVDVEEEPFDPYDFEGILEDRSVDVWHWEDPRIKTHERESWSEREKHLYRAVLHLDSEEIVMLADRDLPDVDVASEADVALAHSDVPYLRQLTWGWFYSDYYVVDLRTGDRRALVEHTSDTVTLSPDGRHAAYFREGDWYLLDLATGAARNLTEDLEVPFANEDHDYPFPAPDYGSPGWVRDGGGLLFYDKYDLWHAPTEGESPRRLTEGRADNVRFRVIDTQPDLAGFEADSRLLMKTHDEDDKREYFHSLDLRNGEVERRYGGQMHLDFVMKAEDADRLVYTEETFTRFPDLWTCDEEVGGRRRVSEVNPQLAEMRLGSAELVTWDSLDGLPLQGVLIKPPNYDPDRRYPVLVYFYRFFSQRLYEFNDPVINHRPSFYVYAGDDYCVFLPDIRFEVGRPGLAATKSLVPGVQMLIDRGIAEPEGVALHGHSWSGYQAAQIITHTDLFACAVAGAPVSNMTSAYGGIRWGTGLSRQFQYEMGQSRLGRSLWEGRDLYIENSPLFFADRIDTPLLIQFGDEDGAVPWTQGIELYMAMRRLNKPCVMLQYHGEPHHLKKYPNKLDYSLKMKALIDHYCKGGAAPGWWTEGVAYEGD